MKLAAVLVLGFIGNGDLLLQTNTHRLSRENTFKYLEPQESFTVNIMLHFDKVLTNKLLKEGYTRGKLKHKAVRTVLEAEKLFQKPSLNQNIRLNLLDVKFLRNNTSILAITENVSKYLQNYCEWQAMKKRQRKISYYSVLVSGLDFFYYDRKGKEVRSSTARSYMGSVCNVEKSCSVMEWKPEDLSLSLAHEIAHGLGVHHDGFRNHCPRNLIMDPHYNIRNTWNWSSCSKRSLKKFLMSPKSWCLQPQNIFRRAYSIRPRI